MSSPPPSGWAACGGWTNCWRCLKELQQALQAKAVEFDDVVKSGRTHLQDAVPVRLGQEFGAYAKAVERDAERIRRSAEGLRRLGIGGTAVGSGLNAHPRVPRPHGQEIIRINRPAII